MRSLLVATATLTLLGSACDPGAEEATPAPAPDAASPSPEETSPVPPEEIAGVEAPKLLRFTAPQLGGGTLDGHELAGRDVALWFWAPW